jgi:hypothetical protein
MLRESGMFSKRAIRNFIVSLSLLLTFAGVVLFALSLSPSTDRWREIRIQTGLTIFQVGAVTLVIELINLDELLSIKIPEAVFHHGYLERVSDEERRALADKLLDPAAMAFVPAAMLDQSYLARLTDADRHDLLQALMKVLYPAMEPAERQQAVTWMLQALDSPARNKYTVRLELKPDGESQTLQTEVTTDYVTEPNRTGAPARLNGNGVIHRFRDTLPTGAELARLYQSGELTAQTLERWIRGHVRPRVEIESGDTSVQVELEVRRPQVVRHHDGRLWLRYDLVCAHHLEPGEAARVRYTYRWQVGAHDFYSWYAAARTNNFKLKAVGFQDYELLLLPSPGQQYELEKLEVDHDEMHYPSLLHPNATFAVAWRPKPG